MPFELDHGELCPTCPFGFCVEDRRTNPVYGRSTEFRFKQYVALACTFGEFAPGASSDTGPTKSFDECLDQMRNNTLAAGQVLFGSDFKLAASAIAKVEGDVFELLEAAALWNAFATWNRFMESGIWKSGSFTCPDGAVPTTSRRVAAISLPRGYDTTKLFQTDVRNKILAFEESMRRRNMVLGLSSPDIVGIRLPEPLPAELEPFLAEIDNLGPPNRELLENAYEMLEGKLEGRSFLFAIAIKRTTRSDRLYQPLFEANVLKFIIEEVLRGAAFRFYAHLGSLAGADVVGHYRAASLISLMRGGEPTKAVNNTLEIKHPVTAAQSVLDDLPLFPL